MKRVLALTWFTRLLFLHERMGSVDDHMQARNFTATDRKLGRAGNETNPAYTQRIGVCSYWRIHSLLLHVLKYIMILVIIVVMS